MKNHCMPVRYLARHGFLLLLGLAASGLAVAQTSDDPFAGKKIVHLLDEPRHRTVFNDDNVYLLDVQVNPGDVSFPHVHDSAILLTYISRGDGPANGRLGMNTDYASEPYTHEVSNSGPGLLRIMALTVQGAGVDVGPADRPAGVSAEPDIEERWFRAYRFELQPGEQTALQTHRHLSFVILGSGDKVHVSREDGITAELVRAGDWTTRQANSSFRLVNQGNSPAIVLVNEARR